MAAVETAPSRAKAIDDFLGRGMRTAHSSSQAQSLESSVGSWDRSGLDSVWDGHQTPAADHVEPASFSGSGNNTGHDAGLMGKAEVDTIDTREPMDLRAARGFAWAIVLGTLSWALVIFLL
jgi:hypothetical protein